MTIEQIIHRIKENNPKADTKKVRLAYDFSLEAHGDQKRRTGELYIEHPLHTAFILAQIHADLPTIIAGLLHDVPEDTKKGFKDIRQKFGAEISDLVEGVTKLSKIRYRGVERYQESLRKMFLAMANDMRVILIKFADRLHNLRTLEGLAPEKRIRISKETLDIYAPIAGLLGIWRLKWQMEDICFKYLYPEEYKKLEYKYEVEKKVELNHYINKIKNILEKELAEAGVSCRIESRFKHLYSIWHKMQNKNKPFDEIYDVFALRVIVNNVTDCYKVLGIVHAIWKPNYNHFKDYIAVPKPNGYRSLHTTVFGPSGHPVEFQIRTEEMHEEALYGVSAHFHYKDKLNNGNGNKKTAWAQGILDAQRQNKNTTDFLKQVKFDVFRNRLFIFTPKGDVIDLPEHSTIVDFAYAIHTDIGNKCETALVNDKPAQLDQQLSNGDMVEIIIDENRKGPDVAWLKFVKTRKAQDKIRQHTRRFSFVKFGQIIKKGFKKKINN